MKSIKLLIQTLEDVQANPDPMPELKGKVDPVIYDREVSVVIQEEMTIEKKSSVTIVIPSKDKSKYLAFLFTENEFNSIITAYSGALNRFKTLKEQRIRKN